MPNGRIGHAEIQIGDSIVMLADACPDWGNTDPKSLKGTPVALCLYVPDVDAVMARAVEAGATVLTPIKDQFYGDRNCSLIDPFGHRWTIATHKEDVSPEEMRRRMEGMFTTA